MGKDSLTKCSPQLDQLKKYAEDLAEAYSLEKKKNKELEAANQELQEAYLDTIHRLVFVSEYKDEDTGNHIIRISRYSALIAEKLGLPEKKVQHILYAAPMHDVGKVGIPDSILLKPGKLTEEEYALMKTHTTIGANILSYSKAEILKLAVEIAISHHEKWNGTGYPLGLAGDAIPLGGRIVGLSDVFDALTSKRPYKDPHPVEVALDIIKEERGKHFDPEIVDIFLKNIGDIVKIKDEVDAEEKVYPSDFISFEGHQSEIEID